MHPGATLLHCDGIYAIWEPAGLSTRMQPGGGERCRSALHGHSDLLCYGVLGEEEFHPQVGDMPPCCVANPHGSKREWDVALSLRMILFAVFLGLEVGFQERSPTSSLKKMGSQGHLFKSVLVQ